MEVKKFFSLVLSLYLSSVKDLLQKAYEH